MRNTRLQRSTDTTTAAEQTVWIVGTPSPESEAKLVRWFERYLDREQPGTRWRVREGQKLRRSRKAASRQVIRTRPGGVGDDASVPAEG